MPTQKEAAEARRAAVGDVQRARMVEALLIERRGYVTRGLADRVRQVDDQLAFYGHETAKPSPKFAGRQTR